MKHDFILGMQVASCSDASAFCATYRIPSIPQVCIVPPAKQPLPKISGEKLFINNEPIRKLDIRQAWRYNLLGDDVAALSEWLVKYYADK